VKRSIGLFVGFGVVAAAAAIAAGINHQKHKPGVLPTLLVGDSMAVGLLSPLRMAGVPVHSIAVEGTTIEYWLGKGLPALQATLATKPGGVLVALGTNDAYNGATYAATAKAAAAKLVTMLNAAGASVYWIGPPSLPSSYGGKSPSQAVVDAIRSAVEASSDGTWIDSSTFALERSADQLHPTGAGYAHWADLIVDQMGLAFVDVVQGDYFGADEPSPRPPPPSVIVIPVGWVRLPQKLAAKHAAREFAVSVLFQHRPMGDLQVKDIDGQPIGALTEYHWDDHVGGVWKWHRGISLLQRKDA
jgi:lysophospholipase L1-like esterase